MNKIRLIKDLGLENGQNGSLRHLKLSNRGLAAWEIDTLCTYAVTDSKFQIDAVQILSLGYNEIKCWGVSRILGIFNERCILSTLDLSFNGISDDGVLAVTQFIHRAKSLHVLCLSGNNIGPDGFHCLGVALSDDNPLEELHLSGNNGRKEGASSLARALRANRKLSKLFVGNCNFGEEGCRLLFCALSENSTLETLNIGGNDGGPTSMFSLSLSLNIKSTSLSSLDLSFNMIQGSGVQALMGSLAMYTGLTALDLKKNYIGDDGAKALAEYLHSTKQLRSLGLGFNHISSRGIQAVASALTPNRTLAYLSLCGNPVKPDGIRYIGMMLSRDVALLDLSLDNIFLDCGESDRRFLASALASNRLSQLQHLTGFDLATTLIQLGSPKEVSGLSNDAALCYVQDMWKSQAISLPHTNGRIPPPPPNPPPSQPDEGASDGNDSEAHTDDSDHSDNAIYAFSSGDAMAARLSAMALNEVGKSSKSQSHEAGVENRGGEKRRRSWVSPSKEVLCSETALDVLASLHTSELSWESPAVSNSASGGNYPEGLIASVKSVGNQPFVDSELWALETFYFVPTTEQACEVDNPSKAQPSDESGVEGTGASTALSDETVRLHGSPLPRHPAKKRVKQEEAFRLTRSSKYPQLKPLLDKLRSDEDKITLLNVLRQLKFIETFVYGREAPQLTTASDIETLLRKVIEKRI